MWRSPERARRWWWQGRDAREPVTVRAPFFLFGEELMSTHWTAQLVARATDESLTPEFQMQVNCVQELVQWMFDRYPHLREEMEKGRVYISCTTAPTKIL